MDIDGLFYSSFKPSVFSVQNVDLFSLRCRCTAESCPDEVCAYTLYANLQDVADVEGNMWPETGGTLISILGTKQSILTAALVGSILLKFNVLYVEG